MTHDIRELTDAKDLTRALEVFFTSLVGVAVPDDGPIEEFVEAGRPLGLFQPGPDGTDELVGTAGSFTSRLVIPGGARVPMAAVTDVGVLPTHTRRGLARALLQRQLEQLAARGEPVATLRASEGTIYERFGYAIASATAEVAVDAARVRLRPTVPPPVTPPGLPDGVPAVRFVEPRASWDLLARIYAGRGEVGTIDRPRSWWTAAQWSAKRTKDALYVVVHGAPGAEDGYLRYHPVTLEHWFTSTDRSVIVDDLVATTPQAYRALLRFLFSVDLLHRIVISKLPVDHGLEKLVLDERTVQTTAIADETWLRLIDVPAALSARTYRGPGAVTIAVTDEQLPANTGRYRVSAAGAQRTDAAPDLSLDVAALAALYLGGTPWWSLVAAGRVVEHTGSPNHPEGAVARADRLFATERAPFTGTMF